MQNQPVVLRREFDTLSGDEKGKTFTITGINDLSLVKTLHGYIAETLTLPDEVAAWHAYRKKALKLLGKTGWGKVSSGLIVSFRVVRQSAYSAGIDSVIDRDADSIHAIQFHTQHDPAVRADHEKFHELILPVKHKIWNILRLPIDFNCRCWRSIVTKEMYKQDPKKYALTPEHKIPKIPKDIGF